MWRKVIKLKYCRSPILEISFDWISAFCTLLAVISPHENEIWNSVSDINSFQRKLAGFPSVHPCAPMWPERFDPPVKQPINHCALAVNTCKMQKKFAGHTCVWIDGRRLSNKIIIETARIINTDRLNISTTSGFREIKRQRRDDDAK